LREKQREKCISTVAAANLALPIARGLALASRIAWEKTVWAWTRGTQVVGFSMIHIHPFFFIAGALCCHLLMLWLIPGIVYAIRQWENVSAGCLELKIV
jgi:hypothetical protein